jgi:hypothetical protein
VREGIPSDPALKLPPFTTIACSDLDSGDILQLGKISHAVTNRGAANGLVASVHIVQRVIVFPVDSLDDGQSVAQSAG